MTFAHLLSLRGERNYRIAITATCFFCQRIFIRSQNCLPRFIANIFRGYCNEAGECVPAPNPAGGCSVGWIVSIYTSWFFFWYSLISTFEKGVQVIKKWRVKLNIEGARNEIFRSVDLHLACRKTQKGHYRVIGATQRLYSHYPVLS